LKQPVHSSKQAVDISTRTAASATSRPAAAEPARPKQQARADDHALVAVQSIEPVLSSVFSMPACIRKDLRPVPLYVAADLVLSAARAP